MITGVRTVARLFVMVGRLVVFGVNASLVLSAFASHNSCLSPTRLAI